MITVQTGTIPLGADLYMQVEPKTYKQKSHCRVQFQKDFCS